MSKDKKINMPSSSAGLTSYYDESESKILISPKTIIVTTIIIAVVTIALNNLL